MVDGRHFLFRAFYAKQCPGKGKHTLGARGGFRKGNPAVSEAIAALVFAHIWLGFPKAAGPFNGNPPIFFYHHGPSPPVLVL